MNDALRVRIADEIAGIVVGEGYYSMTIGFEAALEAADALIAAGVVAEEPEWEYRSHVVNGIKRHVLSDWTDEETALAIIGLESGRPRESAWIERRRPAGEPERVPVKQEPSPLPRTFPNPDNQDDGDGIGLLGGAPRW